MLVPDFPFSYDHFLHHPAGLGHVPEEAHGTEVAVIGAGLAGLVAAYELMRLGLRPVLYEAGSLGGRMKSATFSTAPNVVADLGGMRFPVSCRGFYHYVDRLGLKTLPFPNPLADHTSSTVIELKGERFYAERLDDLPELFAHVARAWDETLDRQAQFTDLQNAIRRRDTAEIKRIWNRVLRRYDDQTFYGFISESPSFADYSYREIFGQVGFGTGGWDTDYICTILEILRVVVTNMDSDQRRIVGGAQRVTDGLWNHAPDDLTHWPAGTSLRSLHGGSPLGAVARLERAAEISDASRRVPGSYAAEVPPLRITDRHGTAREFAAAVITCQSWLLSTTIDTCESLFNQSMWTAIEKSHYMQSSKTFVMVDRPFWKDRDEHGREVFSMTLTDRLTRGTYLLEGEEGEPSVILLSYTWNDDALKWLTLSVKDRVELMIANLEKIYPGLDLRSHIIGEPITVSWESDPNFMGAFKGALPGHYRYHQRLFNHFANHEREPNERGIYLAGDDISFNAGWAEGAVTTALNAVWGVQHYLGGASHPDNPGPGDVFDELGPIDLDA
ncbi:FAD-dependent oxidoreductase [Micrococcales bacterium 31B]|nr:FAD-dependent oxidoreductase [Micrococcales bacterium 31B]